ncbi:MAG: antibiotic biosynthesis monooxygenase [Hyphomonadaceae bacterium]|nr:antibiotic biosynthesis monooxygenase [Hyphomonadaceae bacterium]
MIVIQGYLKVSPENVARVREAAAPLIAATRQEPGCIAYAFAEDLGEPGLIHIAERWASEEALAAHNKTPHLAAFMGQMPGLGPSAVRIARYDAGGEKVLIGG